MNSKRSSYFKNYIRSSNSNDNEVSRTGNSKINHSSLNVVRKLVFKTPPKKRNTQKIKTMNNNNKLKQNFELSEPVILCNSGEQIAPLENNIQEICDLPNESEEREEEDNNIVEKELNFFKEIARLHEIEEASHQIQQEHSSYDGQTVIDSNEFEIETKINFNLESTDDNICVSKSSMDLKCIEDFKEIDNIDFHAIEDIENMTVISDSKRKTAFMAKDDIIFENFEDSKISQTDNCDQTYSFNDSKRIKLQENIKDEAIICNSLENYRNLTKNEIEVENQIDINKNRPDFSVIASNSELDSNQEHGEKISYYNNGDSSHTKNDTQMLQTEKRDEYLKNKHLRQLKRQKYVDFLSDNEDFVWSSSSWEASSAESSEFEVMKKKNTKKIRKI